MEVPPTAPQIRSRITVVCAECKRLKLKCDRRTPCGSCQKRDTISRCVYSPAAAEKVDLHSLNNRLIQVETMLAQVTAGQFQPTYPFPSIPQSSSSSSVLTSSLSTSSLSTSSSQPFTSSTSIHHHPLAIPLNELSSTWFDDLDSDILPSQPSKVNKRSEKAGSDIIKTEPTLIQLNDLRATSRSHVQLLLPPTSAYYNNSDQTNTALLHHARVTEELVSLLPPLETSSKQKTYKSPPLGAVPHSHQSGTLGAPFSPQNPSQSYHHNNLASDTTSTFSDTPNALIGAYTLQQTLSFAKNALAHTHPWLNWRSFTERAEAFAYVLKEGIKKDRDKKEQDREEKERAQEQARRILGMSGPTSSSSGRKDRRVSTKSPFTPSNSGASISQSTSGDSLNGTTLEDAERNIPFFSLLCIAIAVGLEEAEKQSLSGSILEADSRMDVDMDASNSGSPSRSSRHSGRNVDRFVEHSNPNINARMQPAFWYHLSVQGINIWEGDRAGGSGSTPKQAQQGGEESMDVDTSDDEFESKSGLEMDARDVQMDLISALLLQVAFLVRGGLSIEEFGDDGKEKEDSNDVAVGLMGKIVALARRMKLHIDPDDIGRNDDGTNHVDERKKEGKHKIKEGGQDVSKRGKSFSLFESEMRRRMWWRIMYYDLFLSDNSTLPPIISDGMFNTKVPVANVDEHVFGPSALRIPAPIGGGPDGKGWTKESMRGLEAHCLLVQLIRSVKRKMNVPVRYGSPHPYTIEQASSMECEVRSWIEALPDYYKVSMEGPQSQSKTDTFQKPFFPPTPPIAVLEGDDQEDPVLVAQRCELAITAHRLILRIYLPFLKNNGAAAHHQASLGSINAAHGIIHASELLWQVWEKERVNRPNSSPLPPSAMYPGSFDFYPFLRTIFDAAVICAHAVIKQPMSILTKPALEDVEAALTMLKSVAGKEMKSDRAGKMGSAYAISPREAVRIVTKLRTKAGGGSVFNLNSRNASGSKPRGTSNAGSASGSTASSSRTSPSDSTGDGPSPTLKRKHAEDYESREVENQNMNRQSLVTVSLPSSDSPTLSDCQDRAGPAYSYPAISEAINYYNNPPVGSANNGYVASRESMYAGSQSGSEKYPAPPPPPPPIPTPPAKRPASQTSSIPGDTPTKLSETGMKDKKPTKKPAFGIRIRSPKPKETKQNTMTIPFFGSDNRRGSISQDPQQTPSGNAQQLTSAPPFQPPVLSAVQEQHQQAFRSRSSSLTCPPPFNHKQESTPVSPSVPEGQSMDYPLKPLNPYVSGGEPHSTSHQAVQHAHSSQNVFPSRRGSVHYPPNHPATRLSPSHQLYTVNPPYDHSRETNPYSTTYSPAHKDSFDMEGYPAANSPYGAANTTSSGPMSAASSPYTATGNSFGATPTSLEASPGQNFFVPEGVAGYESGYDSGEVGLPLEQCVSGGQPVHQESVGMNQVTGRGIGYSRGDQPMYNVGDRMMYDVKPSVENLNRSYQHPQQQQHRQQMYHHSGYDDMESPPALVQATPHGRPMWAQQPPPATADYWDGN